jgi:riboflavin kinase/FMN adenylyltransferase
MVVLEGSWRDLPPMGGPCAVTLGTFDGVHRGHRAILGEAVRHARARGWPAAAAVTFGSHPRSVLPGQKAPRILTVAREKQWLLATTGIDRLVVLDFDDDLASLEYDVFVREVLRERLGMAHFVLGHDVHFGRGRAGNVATVADLAEAEGFSFSQVASVRHQGQPISSTRIRDCVQAGDLRDAVAMLGHPFFILGQVEPGRGDGRRLGFPTANLALPGAAKLLPRQGVYGGWAAAEGLDGWCKAAVNLGTAPTLTPEGPVRVEVHLLEVEADLVGKDLMVGLEFPIRKEIRFDGVEALKAQIQADVAQVRRGLQDPPGVGPWKRADGGGLDRPPGGR